jgi:hypothetical protein
VRQAGAEAVIKRAFPVPEEAARASRATSSIKKRRSTAEAIGIAPTLEILEGYHRKYDMDLRAKVVLSKEAGADSKPFAEQTFEGRCTEACLMARTFVGGAARLARPIADVVKPYNPRDILDIEDRIFSIIGDIFAMTGANVLAEMQSEKLEKTSCS